MTIDDYLCTLSDNIKNYQSTDKRTDVWSRDFIIWKIDYWLWAVVWTGLWNKRVWADYEQLLRPFFSLFRGQKIFFNFFENNKASSLKIYIIASLQIFFFFNFLNPKNWKNCLFLGLKFQWNLCVNILLAKLWSRLAKKPVIIVQKEQRPGCLKRY